MTSRNGFNSSAWHVKLGKDSERMPNRQFQGSLVFVFPDCCFSFRNHFLINKIQPVQAVLEYPRHVLLILWLPPWLWPLTIGLVSGWFACGSQEIPDYYMQDDFQRKNKSHSREFDINTATTLHLNRVGMEVVRGRQNTQCNDKRSRRQ